MSKSQDTDDPTCVIKMLDEFRKIHPSMNLPNLIDSRNTELVPTRLHFEDSVTSHDNKKRKFTDSNVSVGTADVSAGDSDISVLGEFTNVRQLYSDSLKLSSLLLVE
jgi:hypothetical protein